MKNLGRQIMCLEVTRLSLDEVGVGNGPHVLRSASIWTQLALTLYHFIYLLLICPDVQPVAWHYSDCENRRVSEGNIALFQQVPKVPDQV